MALKVDASRKILFIGDSITDAGRREDPEKVGDGYVRIVRDYLLARDAAGAPQIINRGIGGNKIPDLQMRWDHDVLEIKPDVVSISIGINDVWHGLHTPPRGCDIETFTAGYQNILTRTREALPKAAIVLCEPTVLWLEEFSDANEKLIPYIEVVHAMARQFKAACVVELHDAFGRARKARPDVQWTEDGVHPTPIGHMLMARSWLSATGLL